jgi:hypothetical protein
MSDPMQSQGQGQVLIVDDLISIIKQLHAKYASDEFVMSKLVAHVAHLPAVLDAAHHARNDKEQRRQTLITASDEFIEQFLNECPHYYYNANVELFFVYNADAERNYSVINEDDILHPILTKISSNRDLMPWKYKIKNQVLRRIKDRSLLTSIPESQTIQRTLNMLCPTLFRTRDCAKYFLTVIGDVILKKTVSMGDGGNVDPDPIYIATPKARHFMKGLSQECMTLFGTSLMTAFKFKFYEYSFAECRLMDMNDVTIDAYAEPFKHRIIDIFCVAAHYSQRYENAERFLNTQCKDTVTHERVLYLKHNPEDTLIAKFVTTCTEPSPHNSVSISWKNMLYLWKVFVDDERIPNVFFVNALKARLTQHFPHYSETADAFLQLTSKHLPLVSRFNDFWTHHIAVNANDEDELEIDEFTALFKRHHHQHQHQHQHANAMQSTPMQSHNHTDAAFLGLIRHFCPDVVIENDKHLMHVNCTLWDKRGEVVSAMQEYVEQAQLLGVTSPTSVYKAYEYYCQQQRAKNHASTFHHLIVSKKYFEKICSENGF